MKIENFLPPFISQPSSNIQERLTRAIEICINAGNLIKEIRRKGLTHTAKGSLDTVTQADLASEKYIQQHLAHSFPQDTFYGEELQNDFSPGNVWVIDPIDGTVNFASGSHYWCISIAWVEHGICKLGLIYAPDLGKLFIGIKGYGSFCDMVPLEPIELGKAQQVIVGVGTSERASFDSYLKTLSRLQQKGFEHRRLGSGALMLAEVAAGSLHGYFEPHMNSWDALAGLLLVQEAGGYHLDFLTAEDKIRSGNRVLAACPSISEHLRSLLADIT